MPNDHIGVIVLVIGDHCAPLYNVVSYDVFERLLEMRLKDKQAGKEARAKAGADQVKDTRPCASG
jgi:hypothetical protein